MRAYMQYTFLELRSCDISRYAWDGNKVTIAPNPDRGAQVTWWEYVVTVTGDTAQKDIAAATGIDQSSISRWQRGTTKPRAEAVVALARAYGRSPVEALVAAGYLASDELGVVELTTLTGDLRGASVDSLLSELRRRVLAGNSEDPQSWPSGWSADDTRMGRDEDGEQTGNLSG
ncbi:helix-turn-helix domain-containing protein [Mycolicibacterium komossense]|uniref:Helix-turn-helix transcriptional regulator n=1 Tax=Mycolicibacterium komossense TaxID=1779 RepID=A0ABT3CC80_9MYCO|nr:helix-turn-helix transcriptional regulator [Mycolicibacterium komossense]MCV7227022.1 helix-turn-helix transcriptional regulator [Mycolicibacterium komossense]